MEKEIFEEIYQFNGLKDWQHQIIEAGIKFYEKYKVQPQFIRIKDEVLVSLFEEAEKNYLNPIDSNHSILDGEGVEIVPLRRDVTDSNSEAVCADGFTIGRDDEENDFEDEDEDIEICSDDEIELDDEFYEVYEFNYDEEDFDTDSSVLLDSFGFTEDGRIEFVTSKYSLYFLEGEDLDDNSFALNYGENPDSEEEEM